MIDATGSTNNTTSTNTATGKGKSVLGKDDFMKLMISQLKYQDPLNPMEGAEFAAQLAQFTSLEQLSNMNEKLETSINANYLLTQSVNNTMTAALIGKEVKISGSELDYSGQDDVNIGYKLLSEAGSLEINVYDSNGKLVKTFDSPEKSIGEHKLSWDFTDNNGNKVAAGKYTFEVKAKATNGSAMDVQSYKFGLVNAVRFTESGTKLIVNKTEYLLSDIMEITGSEEEGGN